MATKTSPGRWFIVNPHAGSWEQLREGVERFCAGPGCEVMTTKAAGDAERLAREAAGAGVGQVVSVGGDGTLHEIINGLMASGRDAEALPLLGVLPGGTGNDFARTLELPRDLEEAWAVLDGSSSRLIDLVSMEQPGRPTRYMHNAATGGFSTVMAEKLGQSDKKKWGALSYVVAGVSALGEVPDFSVRIEAEEDRVWESASCAVVVGNGRYAGGGLNLIPSASMDDGWLDVMWVTACSTLERAETLARFVTGRHTRGQGVETYRCREVTVRAEPTMLFNVDGEPIARSPVTFRVLPRSLRVLAPPLPAPSG